MAILLDLLFCCIFAEAVMTENNEKLIKHVIFKLMNHLMKRRFCGIIASLYWALFLFIKREFIWEKV